MQNKSVLVIGGGIAGIQTSLDLANKGIKVYLVEKEPSIGGNMARLDKTFPTNDCSLCILAPKMNECISNENIDILSFSEVIDVKKSGKRFIVQIKKKSRFIDENKCTGCGECCDICPVEMPDEFDMGLRMRKAIFKPFPQAVPNIVRIDKTDVSPCVDACPASVNAHGYTALISQSKFKEAYELILASMPFPSVCGRICHRPCEKVCTRGDIDDPVAIAHLKRFVADYYYKHFGLPPVFSENTKTNRGKVAIIGSGPAGLTCGYFLTGMGYDVTVFEKLDITGGMLAVGIPEYRLPNPVLQREIEFIEKSGVKIRTKSEFGRDFDLDYLQKKGFKAVFIGIGAHISMPMRIPGEDKKGVFSALSFLKKVKFGERIDTGKNVVVIGGGNAAIDSARTALRTGAKQVTILYRRSRNHWQNC